MKKVTIVHTAFELVEVLGNLFNEILPEVELTHIVDDSIIKDLLKEGYVTKSVTKRALLHFQSVEYYGADCILSACSTLGEVVDIARRLIGIPIVKIDEKMIEEVVSKANNIGVLATVGTTLEPTCKLIEQKATKQGKIVNIKKFLCKDAFRELMKGNYKKHDEIVLKDIKNLINEVEVLVLAQASMGRLASVLCSDLINKVFTSARSGVLQVKDILGY